MQTSTPRGHNIACLELRIHQGGKARPSWIHEELTSRTLKRADNKINPLRLFGTRHIPYPLAGMVYVDPRKKWLTNGALVAMLLGSGAARGSSREKKGWDHAQFVDSGRLVTAFRAWGIRVSEEIRWAAELAARIRGVHVRDVVEEALRQHLDSAVLALAQETVERKDILAVAAPNLKRMGRDDIVASARIARFLAKVGAEED